MRKLLTILLALLPLAAIGQTVSNVAFKVDGKELTVTYDLDQKAGIRMRVVTHIGDQVYITDPIDNLSGDVGNVRGQIRNGDLQETGIRRRNSQRSRDRTRACSNTGRSKSTMG